MSKLRVFIVDDSVLSLRILTVSHGEDAALEIVGFVVNGKLAVPKTINRRPDVVIVDVEIPEMNGLGAVREPRKNNFKAPAVMFSTVTKLGLAGTRDALSAGASGYVNKPNQGQNAAQAVQESRARHDSQALIRDLGKTLMRSRSSQASCTH